MADERQRYEQQIEAARQASNRGDRSGAERLLIEALVIGERAFGAEHPSLGTVLNELGRLYVRQGQHGHAEEVLERLLRITKAKGDEHPDVATALAGLAVVKRALGDDAAAEERFREALRIRERALAPQHMATVVAMEQLSETCAARGNVAEALALLQRALPTREAALGAEHATVGSLRARIAELELRALASAFAATEPMVDSWVQPEASTEPASAEPTPSESAFAPAPTTSIASPQPAPTPRPRRKRFVLFAFAGVTAVALATAGMTARSRAEAGSVQVPASATTEPRRTADSTTSSTPAAEAAGVTATDAAPADSQNVSSTGIVQAGAPMPVSPSTKAAPKLPRMPKNLAAVAAQLVAAPNADSIVRASTLPRESSIDRIGPGVQTSSH